MLKSGGELFAREVIDVGDGIEPSGTMEIKVITHDEKGCEVWSSSGDYTLYSVR